MQYKITVACVVIQMILLHTSGNEFRASCPDPSKNGLQCSKDCKTLGYCYNNTWTVLETCGSNSACLSGHEELKCIEGAMCDISWTSDVQCIESGIKVPNLEDPTCSTYYECETPSKLSRLVSPGVPQYCPAGKVFDPCTQGCSVESDPWNVFTCNAASNFTPLSLNNKFAYACINMSNAYHSLVWKYCEKGTYDNKLQECNINGIGICDDVICTEPFPNTMPFPNTNCKYRLCFDGNDHIDINCPNGYHFDESYGKCVEGICSENLCRNPGPMPIPNTNCKYRLCLDDGTFVDIDCATGYHFDESYGKCVEGICSEYP